MADKLQVEFGEFGVRLDESGSFARGTIRLHLVLHDKNISLITFVAVAKYIQIIDPRFRELGLNQGLVAVAIYLDQVGGKNVVVQIHQVGHDLHVRGRF